MYLLDVNEKSVCKMVHFKQVRVFLKINIPEMSSFTPDIQENISRCIS